MPDREKVIKGLRICVPETQADSKLECSDCPYGNVCNPNDIVGITLPLIWDIRALLKEQEAEIKRLKGELHGFGDLFHALSEKTEKVMAEQPDIVRCKECKHRSKELYDYCGNPKDKRYVCEINDVAKKPDWFCGDGERGEPEWPASTFVPLG